MNRTHRLMLIALMMFSFTGIFMGLAGTALAAGLDNCQKVLTVNDPSGYTMNCVPDDSANPAPAPTTAPEQQPAPPIASTSEDDYREGYKDGKTAGKDPNSKRECPPEKSADYCKGWDRGYGEGLRLRPPEQGQGSGIGFKEILGAALGAILVVGAILMFTPAGVAVAGGAAGVAARFFGGKKP